ncbi:MAG: MFS transporter [Actinomycetes bacterium]
MPDADPQPRALDALRVRDFRLFWMAALVSNTGGWMQNATIPYVIYELTGRAGQVGLTGFFQYVPFMVMGLVGGYVSDRFARRGTLIVVQLAQAVAALLLWIDVASGVATPLSVTALAFASGLLGGLNTPVWQAFVVDLVPRDRLMGAVTLNSTQFNASRAIGPFLAGVIIAAFGASTAFLLNAVSFFAVVLVLLVIRGRPSPHVSTDGLLAGVRAAAAHIWRTPALVACCTAIIVTAGLGSPLFSFLPVYGASEYDVTGVRLGLLLGAGGIGAVVAAPFLLSVVTRVRRAVALPAAMCSYAVAVALTGLVRHYVVALLVLMLFGGAYLAIASTINTSIQLVVADHLRGKVIAVYLACLTGALPLGLLAWGWSSDRFGLRPTTVAAGAALVAATGVLVVTGRFTVMVAADAARDAALRADP